MAKTKGKKGMKRSYRRRRQQRKGMKTTISTLGSLNPIAPRYITKLKYAEAVQVSGIGVRSYQWNLNSLFDPNRSGVGHQPYGFDNLCGPVGVALYNRYRVYRVDYVVSVLTDSYNNHYAVLCSNDATPPITNVSEARENPRSQYAIQNTGGTVKKITGSISLPSLTGRTKDQYMAGDNYQALYNQDPSEVMTLGVYCQGVNDDVSVPMTHTINILLQYHVEFFDPHALDQS